MVKHALVFEPCPPPATRPPSPGIAPGLEMLDTERVPSQTRGVCRAICRSVARSVLERRQSPEHFIELCYDRIVLLVVFDEEGGDVRRQDAEQGDAGEHEQRCDASTSSCDREGVAVTDGRHGRHRPPQRIAERVDAPAAPIFDCQRQGRRTDYSDE